MVATGRERGRVAGGLRSVRRRFLVATGHARGHLARLCGRHRVIVRTPLADFAKIPTLPGMEPIGWQVIVRCRDNRVIAPTVPVRQLYVASVLGRGENHGLYTFGLADTHGHHGIAGSREQAGKFARELLVSLSQTLPGKLDFAPAHLTPIREQAHLGALLDYVLRQDKKHGINLDVLREGTAAFDYLGMRLAGQYLRDRVASILPRLDERELGKHLPAFPRAAVVVARLREAMTAAAVGFRAAAANAPAPERAAAQSAPPAGLDEVEAWFDSLSPESRRTWLDEGSP